MPTVRLSPAQGAVHDPTALIIPPPGREENKRQYKVTTLGILLGILGGDVPPGSPNSDAISDEKMSFFTTGL